MESNGTDTTNSANQPPRPCDIHDAILPPAPQALLTQRPTARSSAIEAKIHEFEDVLTAEEVEYHHGRIVRFGYDTSPQRRLVYYLSYEYIKQLKRRNALLGRPSH